MKLLPLDTTELLELASSWLARPENDQWLDFGNGRQVITLSSNNYLGLNTHPRLKSAALEAVERFGAGSGAVRTIAGTMSLHEELEERLASFKHVEAVLTFQSGFTANTGLIPTITGEHVQHSGGTGRGHGVGRDEPLDRVRDLAQHVLLVRLHARLEPGARRLAWSSISKCCPGTARAAARAASKSTQCRPMKRRSSPPCAARSGCASLAGRCGACGSGRRGRAARE